MTEPHHLVLCIYLLQEHYIKATRVLSTKPGQKYMTGIDMDYLATAETNPILENSLGFGALTT